LPALAHSIPAPYSPTTIPASGPPSGPPARPAPDVDHEVAPISSRRSQLAHLTAVRSYVRVCPAASAIL